MERHKQEEKFPLQTEHTHTPSPQVSHGFALQRTERATANISKQGTPTPILRETKNSTLYFCTKIMTPCNHYSNKFENITNVQPLKSSSVNEFSQEIYCDSNTKFPSKNLTEY